jgi:hypothetical protein
MLPANPAESGRTGKAGGSKITKAHLAKKDSENA